MQITEVRVALRGTASVEASSPAGEARLPADPARAAGERRLKAYATVTFDHCFVVRNIKIIEGKQGLFVAMPSHKPKAVCPRCYGRNDAGNRFCVQCGVALARQAERAFGAPGLPPEAAAHRDIAHPITVEFRQYLEQTLLAAYEAERARGRVPSAAASDID
jgi:stage V sporulation protein G